MRCLLVKESEHCRLRRVLENQQSYLLTSHEHRIFLDIFPRPLAWRTVMIILRDMFIRDAIWWSADTSIRVAIIAILPPFHKKSYPLRKNRNSQTVLVSESSWVQYCQGAMRTKLCCVVWFIVWHYNLRAVLRFGVFVLTAGLFLLELGFSCRLGGPLSSFTFCSLHLFRINGWFCRSGCDAKGDRVPKKRRPKVWESTKIIDKRVRLRVWVREERK